MSQFLAVIRRIPRRNLELVAAIFLAAAAFFVAWFWSSKVVDRSREITVVAAARDLTAPVKLTAGDVRAVSVRRDNVPSTALINVSDASGRTLTHSVSKNQIITTNEISTLDVSGSGYRVPYGSYGFMVNGSWFAGPLPSLKSKDRVTIIVSGAGAENEKNTGVLGAHVPVLEVAPADASSAGGILLGLDQVTAVKILKSKANGLILHLLLDGTGPAL